MSDAVIIAAVLFAFIPLWGAVVFLIGWKESAASSHNKLRHFWIVVFAACGIALLIAVFIRTSIPRNAAVKESTQLTLQSPQVQMLLGNPIHYNGFRGGGYQGIGKDVRVFAAIQFKGSKQSGTLHSCAIKREGQWQLLYAQLTTDNDIAIPLTNVGSNPCQP